jgi:hypothetical protein
MVCVDAPGNPPCSLNIVSAPKVFERSSTQLGVRGSALDVGVTEPQLPRRKFRGITKRQFFRLETVE